MTIAILILGAGSSSRMRGGDKLLEPVGGVPVLRLLAGRALETGAQVGVTLPPDRPARGVALDGLAVRRIAVPDAGEGMAASLRRGAASFAGAEAMMVLPGDMPGIETSDISALIDAFRTDPARPILRACAADGTPGHPVLFPRRFLPEFATLSGDAGAAPVLHAHRDELRLFPLPGRRSVTDLDTPEAWAAWRDGADSA